MLKKLLRLRIRTTNLHRKKRLLLAILIGSSTYGNAQISDGIFGQNANLTDTVGTHRAYGHLDDYWNPSQPNQNYILESKTKFMRYGGNEVEKWCLIDGVVGTGSDIDVTIADYIAKAKKMQDNGITAMMTLPFKFNGTMTTLASAASHAGKLVKGVNNGLTAAFYQPITYWIYSNEPEIGIHVYDGTDAGQKIHDYIKSYHDSVMASTVWNSGWGTAKFVGPELFTYDNYSHGAGKVKRLIEQLTGQYNQVDTTHPTAFDITPYLTWFTWHFYPFNDESSPTTGVPDPTRSNVINRLTTPVPKHGGGNTRALKDDINEVQAWIALSSNTAVKVAITEANICYKDDVSNTYGAGGTNDSLTGNGANSLICGQFMAEMAGICMNEGVQALNVWSSLEGCGTGCTDSLYKTNVGFLNSDPAKFGGLGGKKPSFFNFKLLSENFAGGTSLANSATNTANYKTFVYMNTTAPKNDIGVLIINQHIQSPRGTDASTKSLGISFNNGNPSDTIKVKLNLLPAPAITNYSCTITNETSMLLVFDRTTGALKKRQTYSLQDALRTTDTGTFTNISTQGDYDGYFNNVHSDIKIGTTPSTTITAGYDKVFRATNSIQLNGPFSSGTIGSYKTLSLQIDQTCQ